MKKLLLLFSLIVLVSVELAAQDIIVLNSGDVIKAFNIEVGKTSIFYTLSNDANSEIHKLNKTDIIVIKKANGEKLLLDIPVTTGTKVNDRVEFKQYGDLSLPNVDIDSYKGFLLKEGNAVFIESGETEYEIAGANRLRELMSKNHFWKLAATREQAHFILRYYIELRGIDHVDEFLFDTKIGLEDIKSIEQRLYLRSLTLGIIKSSESISENIKSASKLYNFIQGLQHRIGRLSEKSQNRGIYKDFYIQ
jgi:hypothetical protein